ncbi:MAG: hypothetical protein NTW96_14700 [Planctomycetia bacterium]|nr:hypothetical protein [Planctomycetia bacterium]
MNSKKLLKRLVRETTTNPKKAAALGLLAVAALWFWAPLVWGWVVPRRSPPAASGKPEAQTAAAAAMTSKPKPVGSDDHESQHPTPPWEQVVNWMKNDPRMTAASGLPGRADPFHEVVARLTPEQQQQQAEKQKQEAAETPPDPQSLGLVISSTIVGPRRRVAVVNGKVYAEGRTLVVTANDRPIEFRLAKVHPRGVVLERGGKTFEVSLPDPKRSGRVEVLSGQ